MKRALFAVWVDDTGVGDKNTMELKGDSDGHLQDSLKCAEESRALAERVLPRDDHFIQTDGNVLGTQVQTTAACSLWQKGRVEPPSRKGRPQRRGNTKWLPSRVSCEIANEGLRRTGGTRRSHFPFERGGRQKRAGKTDWDPRRCLDFTFKIAGWWKGILVRTLANSAPGEGDRLGMDESRQVDKRAAGRG